MPNTFKSAKELGLPSGNAVMRGGKVTVLPPNHNLAGGQRVADIGPAQPPQMPTNASSQVVLKTSYTDRATGFLVGSTPMWLAFIAAAALIAFFFRGVPLLSVSMVGYMFTGAILSWITSWVIHTVVSPDGTTLVQSLLAFWIVKREQQHRFDREDSQL